jgi:ABC-type multidrug transport system ATPase subunit
VNERQVTLSIDGLSRSFGPVPVLEGLDLRLEAGERLGLSGPNGSGKTTLLRCIAGSLAPSSGSITVAGHPAGSLRARAVTGTAVAHEKAFYQRLSGRENLRFYASLRASGNAHQEAASVIGEMELGFADERVDRYSSGMLQQLSFARALLGEPQLLLLDEPTRSMDDAAIERVWSALARRPGTAVIVASHLHDDLDRCGERVDLS